MINKLKSLRGGNNKMKVEKFDSKTEVIQYDSLKEFYDYLVKTPFNEAFCWAEHSSVTGSENFTKTKSFDEAVDLFKNGWSDMASKLVQRLKVIESKTEPTMKPRNTTSVCGYQAIVPLYLQGVPNNMANKNWAMVEAEFEQTSALMKQKNYKEAVDKFNTRNGR